METDILLEGFKQAELHGLRYTKFIGDGHSSVFPTLVAQVPMWGHAIEKIEYANHAVKCYRSALENLVKEKRHFKGKGKLTEGMHKKVIKAARCAPFTALNYTKHVALIIAKLQKVNLLLL